MAMRIMGMLAVWAASAAAQTPRLFFTDLESGPNTGGENNAGVYVTVWGRNFGASRGSARVTVGGGAAAAYPVWTDTRVTFQLGAAAATGNVVVTTAAGASNGLPFTVRPGNIYFVSPSGSDSADGSFARPWRTLVKAKDTMAAGDTTYAMNGVSQTSTEIFDASVSIERGGAPGRPMALVAYPGATATIGTANAPEFGLRIPNVDDTDDADHWVLSQFVLRGQAAAVSLGGQGPGDWRVVGNDISCPVGLALESCFSVSLGSDIKFLGNDVHDSGDAGGTKMYSAVYFTTDTNHVEAAWNYIHDNRSCRAIQFHSSPLLGGGPSDPTGSNQYDLSVHDNLIRQITCDAINFATVDPSKGKVEAYNNVIIRAGAGPHPPDSASNYSCVYVPGYTNRGPDGTGNVEIYNNTCYDFGAVDPTWPDSGAFVRGEYSPRLFMNLRNNIAVAVGREQYVSGTTSLIRGSNNLWWGNGPGPAFLQNNINADPRFISLAANDLRLQTGSPAIDAGLNTGAQTDFNGVTRPQGSAYDLGALEFFQGTAPPAATGPRISAGGIANVFSGIGGTVAPGEIVSIYGSSLGSELGVAAAFDASGRLPAAMADVTVTFNGISAPFYYLRADQLNVQVPYELAGATQASVVVTRGGQASPAERVAVAATHPGLYPGVFNQDFSVNGARNPAAPGSVVVLYAAGQGVTTPASVTGVAPPPANMPEPAAPVSLSIGGRPATLLFRGLIPGAAGVMQLNAVVPEGIAPGDAVPVILRVGTAESQPGVTMAVR